MGFRIQIFATVLSAFLALGNAHAHDGHAKNSCGLPKSKCNKDVNCKAGHGVGITSGQINDRYKMPDGSPCITWTGTNVSKLEETGAADTLFPLLFLMCKEFKKRIVIFSGYRGSAHNHCVCGACGSRHLRGTAVDFYFDGSVDIEAVKKYMGKLPGGKGNYGGRSFHLDARPYSACWSKMSPYCAATNEALIARAEEIRRYQVQRREQLQMDGPANVPDEYKFEPAMTPEESVELYIANEPQVPPADEKELFTKSHSFYSAGLPLVIGGVAAAGGIAALAAGGGGGSSGDRSPAAGVQNSSEVAASNVVEVPPPNLCPLANSVRMRTCTDNYRLATLADECIYRTREAGKIAAMVLSERSVKVEQETDAASFNDSSYDYKITAAISKRHSEMLQVALNTLQRYRLRLLRLDEEEGPAPEREACYHDPMTTITNAIAEVRKEIAQNAANVRATRHLSSGTNDLSHGVNSGAHNAPQTVEQAVEEFDKKVEDSIVPRTMPIGSDPMENEL